jgi:hypothetical protein
MYPIFPFKTPGSVIWIPVAALAIPKSINRVTPSAPTRMFCGETSL